MTENAARYAQRMDEIKARFKAIEFAFEKPFVPPSWHMNFELVALQLRKIFETIVLATVDSNEGALAASKPSVFEEWHIGKIVKAVEQVNSSFYPVPARQTRDGAELLTFQGEYLTLERLKEYHGRCGDWLHAKAFRPSEIGNSDYEQLHRTFVVWFRLILNLLNYHTVQLADPDEMLWVGMNEKVTGKVFWNKMEAVRDVKLAQ